VPKSMKTLESSSLKWKEEELPWLHIWLHIDCTHGGNLPPPTPFL